MNNTIDARGLSCPQPVIMLKKVLDAKPDSCELLVDNRTAVENTTRYAENAGYKVTVAQKDDEYHLSIVK